MAFLDETGLAELWKLVKAEDAKMPKFAMGSYAGTGTYGTGNSCSLTFDFTPQLVIFANSYASIDGDDFKTRPRLFPMAVRPSSLGFLYDSSSSNVNTKHTVITWRDDGLSWYNEKSASVQLNASGQTYNYIAFG